MNLGDDIRRDAPGTDGELRRLFGHTWATFDDTSSGVPGVGLAAQFAPDESGRLTLVGLILIGDAITAEQLRRVPVAALENSVNLSRKGASTELASAKRKLPPLRRQPGADPAEFSELVAQHYLVWARFVPNPAAALAAEWDVKAPTMASWIREARLRGLLPPARRKKWASS